MVLWRPTRPSRTLVLDRISPPKRYPFHHGDWNANLGSQEIPGIAGEFDLGAQNEARQRLTEFYKENSLVIPNTLFQQHERQLYTWTSPDGQHRNEIDYILCSQRWKSSTQSAKTRLWLRSWFCKSAKFRLTLKKTTYIGKTTRSFRYDLNQISYGYTVEVTDSRIIQQIVLQSAWRIMGGGS